MRSCHNVWTLLYLLYQKQILTVMSRDIVTIHRISLKLDVFNLEPSDFDFDKASISLLLSLATTTDLFSNPYNARRHQEPHEHVHS